MNRILILELVTALGFAAVQAAQKPNVLLILVDDLKPTMGCYGDNAAITPHMDALARRGMRFDMAYCNQAVCAPSRFTLMLGSHSTSTGLYGLGSHLRKAYPGAVTMPQYFAKHGYRTESLGKVFHIGHGNKGDPESFSVPHFHDKVIEYLDPESTDGGKLTREEALFTNQKLGQIRSLPRGAAYESPMANDADYADGRVADEHLNGRTEPCVWEPLDPLPSRCVVVGRHDDDRCRARVAGRGHRETRTAQGIDRQFSWTGDRDAAGGVDRLECAGGVDADADPVTDAGALVRLMNRSCRA